MSRRLAKSPGRFSRSLRHGTTRKITSRPPRASRDRGGAGRRCVRLARRALRTALSSERATNAYQALASPTRIVAVTTGCLTVATTTTTARAPSSHVPARLRPARRRRPRSASIVRSPGPGPRAETVFRSSGAGDLMRMGWVVRGRCRHEPFPPSWRHLPGMRAICPLTAAAHRIGADDPSSVNRGSRFGCVRPSRVGRDPLNQRCKRWQWTGVGLTARASSALSVQRGRPSSKRGRPSSGIASQGAA